MSRRRRLAGFLLAAAASLPAASGAATPAPAQKFVVLREHGSGTPSRAQPYLDQLLAAVAKENQWPSASGRYLADRAAALEYIKQERPDFGILSLSAFLQLKPSLSLTVVGEVVSSKAGGTRYFLVSKRAGALDGCTGQKLATTFAGDAKFIDRVVAGGAFKLADFKLVEARRPLEPLKQVLRDEAACALIDDAQLDATRHIEQGSELKPVWKSTELPGMAVVAFPRAQPAAIASFKKSLGNVCSSAREACKTVGIEKLRAADDERYRRELSAYGK